MSRKFFTDIDLQSASRVVNLAPPLAGNDAVNRDYLEDSVEEVKAFIEDNYSRFFSFEQPTPLSTWTINHNLGFKPSVELFNSGSQEIDGDVVHTSTNQTIVSFTVPVSGFARLT